MPDWLQNVQLRSWAFIQTTITICTLEQDVESKMIMYLQVARDETIKVNTKWQVFGSNE